MNADEHNSQLSGETAILLEESRIEQTATHRRHVRTLVLIIVLILAVGSVQALALMKIANRPVIIVLPTQERAPAAESPAPTHPKNSSSPKGRTDVSGHVVPVSAWASCAAAANRSNNFRRLDPADMAPGKTPAGGSARRVRVSVPEFQSSRLNEAFPFDLSCLPLSTSTRREISTISGPLIDLKTGLAIVQTPTFGSGQARTRGMGRLPVLVLAA